MAFDRAFAVVVLGAFDRASVVVVLGAIVVAFDRVFARRSLDLSWWPPA